MGPVHLRVSSSIEFAGNHLNTWVKRGNEHNTLFQGRARTGTAQSRGERRTLEATTLYKYRRIQILLWKWCTCVDVTFKSKTLHSYWLEVTLISFPSFGRRHTSSELFTVWTNLWHQNFPREVLWIYQVSWPYTWMYVLLMLIRISLTQPLFLFNCFFVLWTDFIHMIKL